MSSAPAVFPFYGEGAGRLFTIYYHVTHGAATAPRMTPTSRTTLHIARSTRVVGKRSERRSYCSKNPRRLPAHRSGPSPTTRRAYVWPRPGGSCRCTKGGVLFCTPLLVRGQLESRLRPHLVGLRKEATSQDNQNNAKPETRRAEGRDGLPRQSPCRGGLRSPGKNLAGATFPTPAEPHPLSPRVPTPSTTLESRLGRHLHGGMQIFVETRSTQD